MYYHIKVIRVTIAQNTDIASPRMSKFSSELRLLIGNFALVLIQHQLHHIRNLMGNIS